MTGRLSGTKTTSQHSSPSTFTELLNDIVVCSDKERVVILVELTVGDESNFSDQVERKQATYNKELIPELHGSGWKAQLFTVEVGCSGFWHHTLPALLNYFGVTKRVKKAVQCSKKRLWLLSKYVPMQSGKQEKTRSGVPATTSHKNPRFYHQLSKL